MPHLSVVIPIYNAEPYLPKCLESILVQAYLDMEVLLVDDGSTDGSADVCKEYVTRDSRFRYIYKDNGGASSARNVGIREARGEWMFFVDADDALPSDAVGCMMSCVIDERVDMVVGAYTIDDVDRHLAYHHKVNEPVLSRSDAANMMFLENRYGYQGYVWNKLFRLAVVMKHNIRFNEAYKVNEDRLFCVEYICAMRGVVMSCDSVVYNYIRHTDSTIGGMRNNLRILDDYTSSVFIVKLLKKHGFPRRTINLALDNLIFSYDFIRHSFKNMDSMERRTVIAETKKKAICDSGGILFFIGNRVRRFLSRQINHLRSDKIYLESLF